MIGFFIFIFWHKTPSIHINNSLYYFHFIGTAFGIRRMKIKIHTNEKSGYHHLQTSRTLC